MSDQREHSATKGLMLSAMASLAMVVRWGPDWLVYATIIGYGILAVVFMLASETRS